MVTLGGFVKNVILPVAGVLLLLVMFEHLYMKDGTLDFAVLWICVGMPYGVVRKRIWVFQNGGGVGEGAAIFFSNFLIGGITGGFVVVFKLLGAVWYCLKCVCCLLKCIWMKIVVRTSYESTSRQSVRKLIKKDL